MYARPQSSPLERSATRAPPTEALGYVYLTLDRTRLVQFRIAIAAAYVLLMGISALGLLLWFRRRVRVLDTEVALMTADLREAYSAALTASQHKSEFLATITHELRTPIASIRGFAELALQDLRFAENAGPAGQRIKSMQEVADNILKRVGDILIFAQAEAGKADITMGEIKLRPFIQHITDLFQPVLIEKGNTFTVSITGPEYMYTDENKLFHIVSNLLSNACKFTEEGAIEMIVTAGPDTLTVAIEDNGIGMKDEHVRHVFEPFYQADMSDTRQHSGVGLGLAIAKRYCELLGGTVKVTSEPGVGSRFQVDIPAARP
ncbi:MAG: sensor histidine kinase [Gammaproteobacteria bacterium]